MFLSFIFVSSSPSGKVDNTCHISPQDFHPGFCFRRYFVSKNMFQICHLPPNISDVPPVNPALPHNLGLKHEPLALGNMRKMTGYLPPYGPIFSFVFHRRHLSLAWKESIKTFTGGERYLF